MDKNYSNILESYLIPVTEELHPLVKAGSAIGLFGIAAYAAKDLRKAKKEENRKRDQILGNHLYNSYHESKMINDYFKAEEIKSSKMKEESIRYAENTTLVIKKMEEECPDLINKEFTLRKSELRRFANFISSLSKKIKVGGFSITNENILSALNNSNDNEYCGALDHILPMKGPKTDSESYYYDNYFYITVCESNIYDWNDIENNGSANVRDYNETEYYHMTMNNIMKIIDKECTKYKCILKSSYGGDWDDGPIDILIKPSDEFIKVAKKYGWKE